MGGGIGEFIAGLENLPLLETISRRFNLEKTAALRKLGVAVVVLALLLIAVIVMKMSTDTPETTVLEANEVAPEQTSARFDEVLVAELTDTEDRSSRHPVVVYVTGAVVHPGVLTLENGQRISDAIALAGGLQPDAAQAVVNFAQPLTDGMQVHIPRLDEVASDTPREGLVSGEASVAATATPASPGAESVNINTADLTTLQTLTGIGPATAQKIIDYRTAHGRFQSKEDLMKVSGIGEKKYAAIESMISI